MRCDWLQLTFLVRAIHTRTVDATIDGPNEWDSSGWNAAVYHDYIARFLNK